MIPFVELGRLTVSSFGKCVHVREYILDLNLGVTDVLLQEIHRVFRFQRMKPVQASRFVLYASLELLQPIVGRFHFSVHFLCQSLKSFESRNKNERKMKPSRISDASDFAFLAGWEKPTV